MLGVTGVYAHTFNSRYPPTMTAYDKIDLAFARSCFRQAKKLMTALASHYRHTEPVVETLQELDRRIEWAMDMKKTMPDLYEPQRLLRLRAKRYVLRRRPEGRD